jgi:sugar phosphate isomerase/epimerase
MSKSVHPDIYFSFFMFTVDLKPGDSEYAKVIVRHMKELRDQGYTGFDVPIAPGGLDHTSEVENYKRLRQALDDGGLGDLAITTNVGATRTFDPSSMYREQRELGLAYLKSRVDITKALRGHIMAGPVVLPYGVFPTTDFGQPIWSDALHEWLEPRYRNAQPVIEELAEYAETQDVKVAIEPVDHWETPAANVVKDVTDFLEYVPNPQVGVCIDSAHVVLGSEGPAVFTNQVERILAAGRLHSVHVSSPDRGAVHDSWIPWRPFLTPILEGYAGPLLIEVFNGIPVFLNPLRITRKKFWIPGEDTPVPGQPDAYTIAKDAIATLCGEIDALARSMQAAS